MTTFDYSQDKHYCTDGEICDTCWMCPACCPGLENCAIALEAEDDEAVTQ
jgi:hypothetical protein